MTETEALAEACDTLAVMWEWVETLKLTEEQWWDLGKLGTVDERARQ